MIGQLSPVDFKMSPDEYLEWEAQQDGKYEYENGTLVAMTGGTVPHSQIAPNFSSILIPHLRGKGCKVAISDAKVMTRSGKFFYPDLVVSCDERDRNARDYLQYPCLIAEVISPSTEARDRGIKQQNYMGIPTLNTYILINPEQPQLEIYQRQQRTWDYVLLGPSESMAEGSPEDLIIEIAALGLEFPLSLIYENIDLRANTEDTDP
jgi:Uma2 family endonuclease